MRAAAVTSCPGRATAKPERRPGTQERIDARSASPYCASRSLALGPGSRSARFARCTRPGHESAHCGSPLPSSHDVKQPSQRFACPLNLRARRRVSPFSFLPNGERSAETAQTCRACEARPNHAVEAWCASCGTRPPLGAPPWRFWAGGRASVSGIASGECVQRAPRSAGHSAWRAGSRTSRGARLRAAAAGRHSPLRFKDRLEKRPSPERG